MVVAPISFRLLRLPPGFDSVGLGLSEAVLAIDSVNLALCRSRVFSCPWLQVVLSRYRLPSRWLEGLYLKES